MEKTFEKFCIPKIKKVNEYQLKIVTMNVAISTAYSLASDAENGKIEITPAIPFVPESTVGSERTDENKNEFISVTCVLRSSPDNSKKIIM